MDILGGILGCGVLLALTGILFPLLGPRVSVAAARRVRFWTLTPGIVIMIGVAIAFILAADAWAAPYRTSGGSSISERSPPVIELFLGLPLLPFYFLCRLLFPAWTAAEHYPEFLLPVSLLDAYGWTAIIYVIRKLWRKLPQT
ncbi:MAG TPA: hypothetical protein VJU77_12965 [Chthoniobacterales bacterium]|nr:hypothetical protein [Chthoniobacterales bacterium]